MIDDLARLCRIQEAWEVRKRCDIYSDILQTDTVQCEELQSYT